MTRLRRRSSAGFTLVELAVVVVIVGVLSVVAVVGYRKLITHGKVAEAQNVISAIRVAQEDYRSERGTFASLGAGLCPNTAPGNNKTQWSTQCSGGSAKWENLNVHVADPVLFGYATTAGNGAFVDSFNTTWVNWAAMPSGPFYQIYAKGDCAGDGAPYTEFVTSSGTNVIFSNNEGE